MAKKQSKEGQKGRKSTSLPIDISQAVNRTITLPSALKPAKPPKGIKWDRPHISYGVEQLAEKQQGEETAKTGESDRGDSLIDQAVN